MNPPVPLAAAASPRQPLAAALLAVLLLLTWFCYQAGLGGPLLLDDVPQLQPLLTLLDVDNWRALAPDFLISVTGPGGRPVAMLTLIASSVVHGGQLAALKTENLLLHLLCGLLLLRWLLDLQHFAAHGDGARATPVPAQPPWLPLIGCALWLLHPLQVSTVLYTVQRMTVLSTLFTLSGLLLYLRGRLLLSELPEGPPGRRRQGILMLLACLLLCLPLATLSKENGILLLPLCALQEGLLLRDIGPIALRRWLRGLFALSVVLPLVLACTVLAPMILAHLQKAYALRGFSLAERVLTEPRVLLLYLGEWAWPLPANLPFFHDDIVPSRGAFEPALTLPACGLLLAALVAAWRARRRAPLLVFGGLIFLVGHSLEGSVVPLELAFEHRNYLPGVGFAVMLIAIPWRARLARLVAAPRRQAACILAGLLPVLVLAALTAERAWIWGEPGRLYPQLFAANPASPRLAALFADSFANAGQFPAARAALARQATVGADLQRADIDCLARVPFDPARLQALLAGLDGVMAGYEVEGLTHLANDVLDQRCGLPLSWGLALLERALRLPINQASSRQLLLIYRAHLHHALNAVDDAQRDLDQAAAIDPGNPLPLLLSAEWWLDAGRHDLALDRWTAARRARGPRAAEQRALVTDLGQRLGVLSR